MKPRILQLPLAITLAAATCVAETGYVTVLVQDAQQHPVRLVEIEIENNGGSKLTKDDGMAQLPLAKASIPPTGLHFVSCTLRPAKTWKIVSPWDYDTQVPSFAENPENFIKIVVVQKGDRAALESGRVLISFVAKINKANAPKTANPQAPPPDPKEALIAVQERSRHR
jgi:hypothetical protein